MTFREYGASRTILSAIFLFPRRRSSAIKAVVQRDQLLATRRSLVDRLGDWRDEKNWQDFFDTYWRLIYGVARKAGLGDAEAQDVVQETLITVAKKAENLRYDPAAGSFKAWLLQVTRWRIVDQVRKRPREGGAVAASDDSRRTAVLERAPDPAGFDLEAAWETEWQEHLLEAALGRVKRQADAKQFQIFDCYVVKAWPAQKVAKELRVNLGQVYLAKHRLGGLLKKELKKLELPPG